MIKAIIFDCFGVLTVDGWLKFCDEHFQDGPKRDEARRLIKEADAGHLSYEDFLKSVEQLSDVPAASINYQMYENHPKNEQLLAYIRDLRGRGYKIGLLSNISRKGWFKDYFTPEEYDLFDDYTLSVETGLIKPDPRIYDLAVERLGIKAPEAIFVDDRGVFAAASETEGMQGVVYHNFDQFKTEMEQLLAADSDK